MNRAEELDFGNWNIGNTAIIDFFYDNKEMKHNASVNAYELIKMNYKKKLEEVFGIIFTMGQLNKITEMINNEISNEMGTTYREMKAKKLKQFYENLIEFTLCNIHASYYRVGTNISTGGVLVNSSTMRTT